VFIEPFHGNELIKSVVNNVNEDGMGRAFSTNGEKRNAYRILVGKPEEKRPLGRPGRRWVDNFKADLREIGWDGMDWMELARERSVEGSCEHDETSGSLKMLRIS
jgi:hypothetical protein